MLQQSGGDKGSVGVENRMKRGRPVKRWIDVIEEDMIKRGVMRQDAGYSDGWRKRTVNDWLTFARIING